MVPYIYIYVTLASFVVAGEFHANSDPHLPVQFNGLE
jgi:hypothetical protein